MGKLTDQGYIADRLDDIFSGLVTKFKGIYGDDILTDPDDPDGQMIGIFAQMRADIEGVIETVVQANDPDNATGTWLEQKVAFAITTTQTASGLKVPSQGKTGGRTVKQAAKAVDKGNQQLQQAELPPELKQQAAALGIQQ
ncbi:hypothetical protein K6R05_21995 (plasmid) [Pantoea alfalfae]|uniref:hypothetical protein n=1 Tax=Pantoea alfalfae TaxID=3074822 RepID=UPI001CA397A0|nr:hypothetical protein [Pantoea alfalfae]QZX98206.1 hypothetical protein K6R05_21995 [Pantoea alfalfae]